MEAFIAVRADIRQTCRLLSLIRAVPFCSIPLYTEACLPFSSFGQWNYVAHDSWEYDWYSCHPLWPCNYDRQNVQQQLYNCLYWRHRPCWCHWTLALKHTVIVLSSCRLRAIMPSLRHLAFSNLFIPFIKKRKLSFFWHWDQSHYVNLLPLFLFVAWNDMTWN